MDMHHQPHHELLGLRCTFKQTCHLLLLVLSIQHREVRAHGCAMLWIQQQGHLEMMLHTLTKLLRLGMPVRAGAFRTGATVPSFLQPVHDKAEPLRSRLQPHMQRNPHHGAGAP